MSAVQDLRTQIDAARALVAQLYPILENDDVLARDMVEGETDLHEAIRQGVARIVELRSLKAGVASTMQVLADRRDRFDEQENRIREAMREAMEVAGLKSLETPLGTVSRKAVPPSVVVTDEYKIPDHFKIPQAPKLDKRAVLAALKDGKSIPGTELSNGGATIQVRLT